MGMIKSVWLVVVGAIGLMSVIMPSNVFAATVNCNLAVSTCVGTDNQDTMTISKLTGSSGFYFIDGKGAGDTIVGNVAQKDPGVTGFVVLFSGGDDKIAISCCSHH